MRSEPSGGSFAFVAAVSMSIAGGGCRELLLQIQVARRLICKNLTRSRGGAENEKKSA